MVDPFLSTVKLFIAKLPPSWIMTWLPRLGDAGNVTENALEVVSMMFCELTAKVDVVVIFDHGTKAPEDRKSTRLNSSHT